MGEKFRKKPVVIEAWPADELFKIARVDMKLPKQVRDAYDRGEVFFINQPQRIEIKSREGWVTAGVGTHMVICGVAGELYPCELSIFEQTYGPADDREDVRETVPSKESPSRNDVLEEAAKSADSVEWKYRFTDKQFPCVEIARVIRALKTTPPKESEVYICNKCGTSHFEPTATCNYYGAPNPKESSNGEALKEAMAILHVLVSNNYDAQEVYAAKGRYDALRRKLAHTPQKGL